MIWIVFLTSVGRMLRIRGFNRQFLAEPTVLLRIVYPAVVMGVHGMPLCFSSDSHSGLDQWALWSGLIFVLFPGKCVILNPCCSTWFGTDSFLMADIVMIQCGQYNANVIRYMDRIWLKHRQSKRAPDITNPFG